MPMRTPRGQQRDCGGLMHSWQHVQNTQQREQRQRSKGGTPWNARALHLQAGTVTCPRSPLPKWQKSHLLLPGVPGTRQVPLKRVQTLGCQYQNLKSMPEKGTGRRCPTAGMGFTKQFYLLHYATVSPAGCSELKEAPGTLLVPPVVTVHSQLLNSSVRNKATSSLPSLWSAAA